MGIRGWGISRWGVTVSGGALVTEVGDHSTEGGALVKGILDAQVGESQCGQWDCGYTGEESQSGFSWRPCPAVLAAAASHQAKLSAHLLPPHHLVILPASQEAGKCSSKICRMKEQSSGKGCQAL